MAEILTTEPELNFFQRTYNAFKQLPKTTKSSIIAVAFIIAGTPLGVVAWQDFNQNAQVPLTPPITSPISHPTSFGKAIKFAYGHGNYVEVVPSQNLNPRGPMTLETWVTFNQAVNSTDNSSLIYKQAKFNNPSGYGSLPLYSLNYNKQIGFSLLINDTSKQTYGNISSYFVPKIGIPYHVAGVYDGKNIMLFIDGQLKSSGTMYRTYKLVNDTLPLDFQPQFGPNSSFVSLPVTMDEVRISNTARYSSTFSIPTSPFINDKYTMALYHFNGKLQDASGHFNNGRKYGDVSFVKSNVGEKSNLYYRVFVTSQSYGGNLGGLKGADKICNAVANSSNLGGTWKAWLSDSTTAVSQRFVNFDESLPFKLLNGVEIASNWQSLTSGYGLEKPISITEKNTNITAYAWTNTNAQGQIDGLNNNSCDNWTSVSGNRIGQVGSTSSNDLNWTQDHQARVPCSVSAQGIPTPYISQAVPHLNCFEQTPHSPK